MLYLLCVFCFHLVAPPPPTFPVRKVTCKSFCCFLFPPFSLPFCISPHFGLDPKWPVPPSLDFGCFLLSWSVFSTRFSFGGDQRLPCYPPPRPPLSVPPSAFSEKECLFSFILSFSPVGQDRFTGKLFPFPQALSIESPTSQSPLNSFIHRCLRLLLLSPEEPNNCGAFHPPFFFPPPPGLFRSFFYEIFTITCCTCPWNDHLLRPFFLLKM